MVVGFTQGHFTTKWWKEEYKQNFLILRPWPVSLSLTSITYTTGTAVNN